MDREDLQNLYNEKYEKIFGVDFTDWMENKAPKNESQAFARCMEIDHELNGTYDEWFNAEGDRREELQDYREKLKAEYDLVEEMFHLEANDRNW